MIREFTRAGSYHRRKNVENQDCLMSRSNQKFTVISLADGVSTCRHAKAGAETACGAVSDLFLRKGDYFLGFEPEKTADFVVSHLLYRLKTRAEEENRPVQEYSSTAASVLLGRESGNVLLFNLGDGMILGVSDGKCRILSVPFDSSEGGCCVTTTRHAERKADVQILNGNAPERIIICSDGAWKKMFARGRMKPEVNDLLVGGQAGGLEEYLKDQDCFDDCSFIYMDLQQEGEPAWITAYG